MNYSLTFEEENIFKEGEIFISFHSKIEKIIQFDNCVLVLFSSRLFAGDQNVFCYDLSKQLKWQIAKPIKVHENNYFTGIYLRDSELYAYSVSGVEYQVDKESGTFLKSELIK